MTDDIGTYRAALGELRSWVTTFLMTEYRGYTAKWAGSCWAAHRDAVWEVATLRAAWQEAYQRPDPSLQLAIAWHERRLPGLANGSPRCWKTAPGSPAASKPPQPSDNDPNVGPWTCRRGTARGPPMSQEAELALRRKPGLVVQRRLIAGPQAVTGARSGEAELHIPTGASPQPSHASPDWGITAG